VFALFSMPYPSHPIAQGRRGILVRPGKDDIVPCHGDDASMTYAELRRRQSMHDLAMKRPRKESGGQGAVDYKVVRM
jgi:hypothetical protein